MKEKIKEIDGIKIYPLSYLAEAVLTDEDINNLLDTPSLKYSVIIDMFKKCKINKTNKNIIKFIKTENWFEKYKMEKSVFDEFENTLTLIYQNIYSYQPEIARQYAQWFMAIYSFRSK